MNLQNRGRADTAMTGKPEPAAEKNPKNTGANRPAEPAGETPPAHDEPGDPLKKTEDQPVIMDLINKLMGASFLEESDAMKRLQKVKDLATPGPSKEEMKEKFRDLLEQ
jgi:hypothetical protein